MLKKIFCGLIIAPYLFLCFSGIVLAAETASTESYGTLLPSGDKNTTLEECQVMFMGKSSSDLKTVLTGDKYKTDGKNLLACGIRIGEIHLWMIPYYMRFVLEFIIQISGLACVAATVYGGFLYLFAGVSEDKDKGKKAITYGVMGMVITFLAWGIVNIFIILLTSA